MSTTAEHASATVRTTTGSVRGLRLDRVHAYLGVPYAAPPVGERRFAEPEPAQRWDGVREATSFGATAPQPPDTTGMMPVQLIPGDDYLHVNVYTPDPGATRLPVFVWIHGGGLVLGSNADAAHGPAELAQRGMVVVSVNYRLGFEGYLPLRDAPPNRGVLDWLLALRWVQDNVAGFGGDPGAVTIGGYSAGSGACLVLLGLPQAAGLFHRVIAMSGAPYGIELADAEARADEVTAQLGVPRTAEGLSSVPEDQLLAAQTAFAPIVGGLTPMTDPLTMFGNIAASRSWLGPVIDGEIIPQDPLASLADGVGAHHPVMLGCTANEMDALLGILGNTVEREGAEQALRGIGVSDEGVKRWFDAREGDTPGQVLGAALTALAFRRTVIRLAERRFPAPAPTYLYEFTWQPPTLLRAVHGIDVAFAFDTLTAEANAAGMNMLSGGEPPQWLADDVSGAISRFVLDGDPGWPRYTEADRSVMALDVPSRVRHDPDSDRAVREIFGALP